MSEVGQRNKEDVEIEAEKLGLIAIFPEARELLLDLDNGADINITVRGVIEREGSWKVLSELITHSKSGKGRHAYMLLDRYISDHNRILIQACLGSDPVREALSLIRLEAGATAITALFETKLQAARVEDWRQKTQNLRYHKRVPAEKSAEEILSPNLSGWINVNDLP